MIRPRGTPAYMHALPACLHYTRGQRFLRSEKSGSPSTVKYYFIIHCIIVSQYVPRRCIRSALGARRLTRLLPPSTSTTWSVRPYYGITADARAPALIPPPVLHVSVQTIQTATIRSILHL